MSAVPFIDRLIVYPVKGLAGIERGEVAVTPFGLSGDRRYMLVDPEGRFMTQRQTPSLTRFGMRASGTDSVRIAKDGLGAITLSLIDADIEASMPERKRVRIWDDELDGAVGNAEADAFFSDALQTTVRLVWMPPDARRKADPAFAHRDERVSFADGFPILVLGVASIEELNERLAQPVALNRFRANILIRGSQPWEEDQWSTMQAGEVSLDLVKPCARCAVIATDQETGERSKEPTATLATYRNREGKILVGMNAVAAPVGGMLRVGQAVRVK